MGKLIYIFNRLKEPSSHVAIAFLLSYFSINQVQFDNWFSVATLFFGCLGVFVEEQGPKSKVEGF